MSAIYILWLRELKRYSRSRAQISAISVLVEAMTRYGIPHTFETYEGDHGNRIPQRLEEKVLPFFSNNLSFEQRRESSRR